MTALVVLQPGYLPWLGFFDQMDRADIFVYYDDVQFDKNGWRNRNRIKTASGIQWLSVPVLQKGRMAQLNNAVEIDHKQGWTKKHLMSLHQSYARSPYLDNYLPAIEEVLHRPWSHLVDLDIALAEVLAGQLGVHAETHRASQLGVNGHRNDRLIDLCRHLGADRYISGDAARAYLDEEAFAAAGIAVEWQDYHHPEYRQVNGPFIPYLSVVDLLFNEGAESLSILRQGRPYPASEPPAEVKTGGAGHE